MLTTETKTCTKCHEVKPLNQFHRRRDGYQHICKTCRTESQRADYQERGKSRKLRTERMIDINNFPELTERIAKLEPRLRSVAAKFAHDALQTDDAYSVMVEAILTRCDPSMQDNYIVRCGQSAAQAWLDKALCYNYHVNELDTDSDAAGLLIFEAHTIENEFVERETSAELQAIIDQLPEENRKLITMLSFGFKQKEIARQFHVTEQTISDNLIVLRKRLIAKFPASIRLSS